MKFLQQIKLRNKIFLLCATLVFLTAIVIQANTWWSANRVNEKLLQEDVSKAKAILSQYLNAQASLLVTASKVLTADFGFKRAVATSDEATIQSALDNHGNRINADVMVLTDMSGRVISSSTEKMSIQTRLDDDAVAKLIANPNTVMFATLDKHIYQLMLLPVRAPHIMAYTIVGFEIDQASVTELKNLTGLDISFFQDNEHLLSTSVRLERFDDFRKALAQQKSSWLIFERPAFFSDEMRLTSAGKEPVSVMLVSSLAPFYKQFDETLAKNFLLSMLLAIAASLLSILFARSLTEPLKKLGGLAQDYARGQYSKSLQLHAGEEVDTLASHFNEMGQQIKLREDKIRYQATHDVLTGLPNSGTVRQLLVEHFSRNEPLILVAFSIHNFRQINDRLGADIADACLQALAERLRAMNEATLFSGRLEGAEFFTVLSADPGATQVSVVDRFLAELEHAFKVSELTVKLDLHAGVTLYPHNGLQPETMLRRTDIALDLARQNKQRIHYYEEGEDEAHMQRLAMIESLRQVILAGGNGQLFMMYQPKISLDFQEQPKMEALIRWQRDNKHFVSPELFVNLAEEASLIIDLTYWVFENVMSQLQAWHQKGYLIGAAINVSAQDLAHPEFESFVLSCSEKYQISPSFITLELTERDIMHDEASVVVSLRSLRQAGFSVAIDDYGIGQSSLSKLKGLPVDEIKLDKSFIMNLHQSPKDQLIVRSTIELAHGLGFLVVAEGVENEASLALLRQMRCDYIQGYHISKPLAAEAVVPWQRDYVNENNLPSS